MGSGGGEDEKEGVAADKAARVGCKGKVDVEEARGRGGDGGKDEKAVRARLKVTDYYVCVFVLLFYFLDNLGLVLFSIHFSFK